MCKYCEHIETKYFDNPEPGALRVWWIPQIPMESFVYPVGSVKEAKLMLDVLGQYDLFQMEHNVKGDYSNVGGLQVYEEDSDGDGNPDWCEWMNDDGDGIDDVDEKGNTLTD